MALSDYITSYLGTGLYDYLGWDSDAIDFVVNEVLEALDLETEDQADNLRDLHAVAKVFALKKALRDLSLDYDVSMDNSSYHRSQIFAQLETQLQEAYSEYPAYIKTYELDTNSPYDIKTYDAWFGY
jgi:hypothetical protein